MIKTFVRDRKTGKTTKVIGLLESDPESILIIPIREMIPFYKKEVSNHIATAQSIINNSFDLRLYSKAIIDEGFLIDKETLAKLYYTLGKSNIETIVYGTIPHEEY